MGIFCKSIGSLANQVKKNIGKAAFFAPDIVTSPFNLQGPCI
ncbi:MAG: hypothetical protein V6009_01320 [Candidatus Dasytiphilus stammeri]